MSYPFMNPTAIGYETERWTQSIIVTGHLSRLRRGTMATAQGAKTQRHDDSALIKSSRLIACLEKVSGEIENPDKVLSRWNLEVLLDELAQAVSDYLESELGSLGVHVGCSIIYGLLSRRYYVGGASRDRRKMEFDARYYQLEEHWLTSLTAFSIATNALFVLDDFDETCTDLVSAGLSHESKDCESPAAETRSYCCFPITLPAKTISENSCLPPMY